MTVKEWREKHPKCIYCIHHTDYPPYDYVSYNQIWCKAKLKPVYPNIQRCFCQMFQPY